jgi:hypothetical protein
MRILTYTTAAAPNLQSVQEELIRQSAAGDVLHNDSTTVKSLEWMAATAKGSGLKLWR